MTEAIPCVAIYGPFLEVTYSVCPSAITSATMRIDEWVPNANQVVFSGASPRFRDTGPNLFHFYSSNGAIEGSNAFEFITGATGLTTITLSYSGPSGGTLTTLRY